MNSVRNPYAPGAGAPPPALVGRDALRQQVDVGIDRLRIGRSAKPVLMVGLRGVGKTVLLDQIKSDAEAKGVRTARMEAAEGRSLPGLLAPQLRLVLLQLSQVARARDLAVRGLRALAGFGKAFRLKYQDLEIGFDQSPEPGLADNGDLEADLGALLEAVGRAALDGGSAVALLIDEIQYLPEPQFAALIGSLHRCAQNRLPITMVGAGLPQLRGLAGNAKSYAERLFDFPEIGPLSRQETDLALTMPARDEGVEFEPEALASIFLQTQGYPYFLQEWGKHAWDVAAGSPITLADVENASAETVAALDASFFRVRFDRLRPKEKQYLRAMAELGAGPHRSGDIASALNRRVNAMGQLRQDLIVKGMIWSPSHGDTAFTVPLFDHFMKRIMPGANWKND